MEQYHTLLHFPQRFRETTTSRFFLQAEQPGSSAFPIVATPSSSDMTSTLFFIFFVVYFLASTKEKKKTKQ
jgi:predicted PurR-regulated permease PerM